MYVICICFDSEFSQEFTFNIFQGQLGSSEVKLGSNPSKKGQIGPVDRKISNLHMFHSEFSQEYIFNIFQGQFGSAEVKLGSNSSKRGQIGPVCLIYQIYICFDSDFFRRISKQFSIF